MCLLTRAILLREMFLNVEGGCYFFLFLEILLRICNLYTHVLV